MLFGAFGAVIGMFRLNRLPRLHHPIFYSELIAKASDDGFLISIEADRNNFV